MDNVALQYISQGDTPEQHLQHIQKVLEAGGKWIQLRLKNVTDSVYLETAEKCRILCDAYKATFIVNDAIEIAKQSHADGVHLGLNDAPLTEAHSILGKNAIVGGTANTLADCKKQVQAGADYIGLGPFRTTATKKKLSPILGLKGYVDIISEFKKEYPNIPVVAIGGIQIEDIKDILTIKVSGIAVSGMLTQKENLAQKITDIDGYIKNSR